MAETGIAFITWHRQNLKLDSRERCFRRRETRRCERGEKEKETEAEEGHASDTLQSP